MNEGYLNITGICGEVTGRPAKSTGEPCKGIMVGGKCGTHDCDVVARNHKVNEHVRANRQRARSAVREPVLRAPTAAALRRVEDRIARAAKPTSVEVTKLMDGDRDTMESLAQRRREQETRDEARIRHVVEALARTAERWHVLPGSQLMAIFAWPNPLPRYPGGVYLTVSRGHTGEQTPHDLYVLGWTGYNIHFEADLEGATLDFIIAYGLEANIG